MSFAISSPFLRGLAVAAFAIVVWCGGGMEAKADAYQCPPFEEPQITITPLMPSPRTNDNVSLAQIWQLSDRTITTYAGLREVPVGLTAASMRLSSALDVTSRSMPGEQMVCTQITHLDLQFGFEDTVVYLARELSRPSCAYDVVQEHESKHLAVDRQILEAYVQQLPPLLADMLRQTGVIRASSPAAAEAQLHAMMNTYLQELGASIASVRERQQRQIDTPEEYKRLSASCDGEIARMVRGEGE